jgi:hypothetical protein
MTNIILITFKTVFMKHINERIAGYFKSHPKTNGFFITSDDAGFFQSSDAGNHAGNLQDKSVVQVTRAEVEAWEAAQGEEASFEHVVTEEDLENNPELGEQGVAEGETIEVPVDGANATPAEEAEDLKKAVNAKTVKKKVAKK